MSRVSTLRVHGDQLTAHRPARCSLLTVSLHVLAEAHTGDVTTVMLEEWNTLVISMSVLFHGNPMTSPQPAVWHFTIDSLPGGAMYPLSRAPQSAFLLWKKTLMKMHFVFVWMLMAWLLIFVSYFIWCVHFQGHSIHCRQISWLLNSGRIIPIKYFVN